MIYAFYSKLPKKLKNGIEILVGQAVFKLWIKTFKMLFGSITQELLGLPNFHAIFEFLGQLTAGCIHYPKIKLLIILRFEIFIHMPILPNNYICPKFPLWHWAKSKGVLECEVRWKVGPLRGYCTPGPYFWRLCAFSQKIKQLRTKYPLDLVRNVPRNSKITVLLQ